MMMMIFFIIIIIIICNQTTHWRFQAYVFLNLWMVYVWMESKASTQ